MSATLQQFTNPYTAFPTGSDTAPSSTQISQSQTSGLDTLAEGSQYALEQLQLTRQAEVNAGSSHDEVLKFKDHSSASESTGFKVPARRTSVTESRSGVRKNSASAPVRRRISRACDQCNQLRTKCDGQHPCAHCIGMMFPSYFGPCRAGGLPRNADGGRRIWSDLRICSRTEEAWEGIEKGPGGSSSESRCRCYCGE